MMRVFDRHLAPVRAVAFSPIDPLVFSADESGAAFLWRSDNGEIVHTLVGAEGAIYSSAFSPNGEMLVTTGDNGAVVLWNPATGQEITRFSGHAGKVLAAAFSPDGQTLATAGDDRVVQLWNIASRTSRSPLPEFAGPVNSIAFSPNGRLLATASYDEYLACPEPGISEAKPDLPAGRLVKLWDVETGKELSLAAGHTKQVTDLAFTSDGSRLISASCDGAILTRRVDNGTLESSIRNVELEPIRAIAINSRGESILTGGDDAVLRTWQSLDDLLEQADSLNQRQPKAYRAEERRRYFSTIEP
jgi:WD40 repeat protein